ncbi:MAG: hypothetical protein JXM73_08525 [Anaerolineae bacterium]|nr:hypothetical protein [Anaerolineae bacterium]
MTPISHFVPGSRAQEQAKEVLPRLRWPIPPGVIHAYVEAYSRPGDRVLVPFCQDAAEVRQVLHLERQAIALHYDPVLLLLVQASLESVPVRELDAAVARLGDSLKQGIPLRQHLEALYATTCPACLRPAVADYFIWEQGKPVAKQVRCPACDYDGQAGVEPADLERLADIPARGMHFYYILDRVAPQPPQPGGEGLRPRLESLLDLYTPRNLDALADLTLKIETLFTAGPLHRALLTLLLDCLDRCSALAPLPGSPARRRSLTRPGRFVEWNVWRAFEEAAGRFRSLTAASRPMSSLADSLERYQVEGEKAWAGFVGQGLVRDLPRHMAAHSLPLALVSPPPLDSAAWALSYLWGTWLLGPEAAAPLRPLLRQRTPDPAWYARVMAGSFRTMADLLTADGRILVALAEQRPAVLEALLWAAARAGLRAACLVQSGDDYRLELVAAPPPSTAPDAVNGVQIRQVVVEALVETIQARSEPTPWPTLHAAAYRRLAETGLLGRTAWQEGEGAIDLETVAEWVKAARDDARLVQLADGERGEDLWWLAQPSGLQAPLSDRVEAAAYAVLQETPVLDENSFAEKVYARCPGSLTPDSGLIDACLRAYGHQPAPGQWRLRLEDQPETREAERRRMIAGLLELGRRLGYQAKELDGFDAAWLDGATASGNRVRAAFVVRWQAAVSEALSLGEKAPGARLYLVIPGGRAELTSYKLAHNPLWQATLDEAGWRFIKYRHVRQLMAQQEVDEYALRAIVGLDPIVEREAVQIPLF